MCLPTDNGPSRSSPKSGLWFYRNQGRLYGPVSFADLRAAAVLGFLSPHEFVRRQGCFRWLRAEEITDLMHFVPDKTKKGDAL